MSYTVLSDGAKLLYIKTEDVEVTVPNDTDSVIEPTAGRLLNKVTVTRSSESESVNKEIVKSARKPVKLPSNSITITPDNIEPVTIQGGPYSKIVLNPTTRVDIVSTASSISDSAFSSSNITSYTNNTVSSGIPLNSFAYCRSLEFANIPNLKIVGSSCFSGCDNLTSLDLSEVTEIRERGFQNCANLETLSLPKCISLGNYAFSFCRKLSHLYLGTMAMVCSITSTTISDIGAGRSITVHVPGPMRTSYLNDSNWATYINNNLVSIVGDYQD